MSDYAEIERDHYRDRALEAEAQNQALQERATKAEKLLLSISRLDEPNRLEAVGMAAGYFALLSPTQETDPE